MILRRAAILTLVWLVLGRLALTACAIELRSFAFPADAFAYTNQLSWNYECRSAGTGVSGGGRASGSSYTLRCFVLVRTARQFFQHARFDPSEPEGTSAEYRHLVRLVLRRNPRCQKPDLERIVIPGYANLREFSREHESLLKAESGGAWQSFMQRGNWRMIFPFSRRHQERTARKLVAGLSQGRPPLVHVVCFPELTLNHALLLFDQTDVKDGIDFSAYDPNRADQPIHIIYHAAQRQFWFPATPYFPGGPVSIYEIYTGLLY